MPWKRFDSCGSCLAMSPEVKTASRYCHMSCTAVHCSSVSPMDERFITHMSAISLKGSTKREASIEPRPICASSRASIISAVAPALSMMLPRVLKGEKESARTAQSLAMSLSLPSMASSLTAEPAISSTSSDTDRMPASSRSLSMNPSEVTWSSLPVSFSSAAQWRARSDGLASCSTSGSVSRKSSTIFLSSTYASQPRSSLGIFLMPSWNSSSFLTMIEMFDSGPLGVSVNPTTSAQCISLKPVMVSRTVVKRSYSFASSPSSSLVFSSSGYVVTGRPKSVSPAEYATFLRSRSSNRRWNLRRRSLASSGGRPGTPGPLASKSERNCATSTTNIRTLRTRLFLNVSWFAPRLSVMLLAAVLSLRHA
ncbi:hypothetical protein Ctob_009048 [Chrysochromulina tobinii]|uniref:Uncharacterized protein n=1 Tax=Chrysochromulina tobinii TaxID=1460289 RepID=A0A0M0JTE0_9EUKA|nr:hypothetical protein Ctob_009048 [Chrysochromulina tobinii]|eukprot:KOO29785.1 hypothetical protein Ctob_009048 [Chrysochromulina sp. CCMP291]